jgi:hypothetical protein
VIAMQSYFNDSHNAYYGTYFGCQAKHTDQATLVLHFNGLQQVPDVFSFPRFGLDANDHRSDRPEAIMAFKLCRQQA